MAARWATKLLYLSFLAALLAPASTRSLVDEYEFEDEEDPAILHHQKITADDFKPILPPPPRCPDYSSYSMERHPPSSGGRFKLPYMRPRPDCRTWRSAEVERTIQELRKEIRDPDLFRLFENSFPNTLDTTVTWTGLAAKPELPEDTIDEDGNEVVYEREETPDEELTFITTGDIPAMWLRDSANQLQSYKSLLKPSDSRHSLASLFRGAINLQARYISNSPHCNAFQPPPEANMSSSGGGGAGDMVIPMYDINVVFECKYELDSLAAFLQLSYDYHNATGDTAFFARHKWVAAVEMLMVTADALRAGTYRPDGRPVAAAPYRFTRSTSVGTETLANNGEGSPVSDKTGMVRSAFRPSDDACIYHFLIPANMMFARYLAACAEEIMAYLDPELAMAMADMAEKVRLGVERHGRARHAEFGDIYAYEVDGFGSHNLMDDANLPSLLSAPMMGFLSADDPIYQATRRFALSRSNPYYMQGPVINGTGGPHIGPGMAWPMSLVVRIMTSEDDAEIVEALRQLVSSTGGLGLIHESVNSHNEHRWTRQWFSWANGLFGQMVLDLRGRKPHLLRVSFQ